MFKFLHIFVVIGICFAFQANAMDDLRSRLLSTQPGGKVMQRDARLIASVEVTESTDASEKEMKLSWMFNGPLPYDYAKDYVLTEPTITALRCCPEEIRSKLGEKHRNLAFNFDIGGNIYGPVIGQAGILVDDPAGIPGRCVTIVDKNGFLTDIFW